VEQGDWSRVEALLPELISWAESMGQRVICFRAQGLLAELQHSETENGHPWDESRSVWVFENLLKLLDHAVWRPEPEVDSLAEYGLRQSLNDSHSGGARDPLEFDGHGRPERSADSFRF
jgi:hypothetical protein